jgi:DNA helicase IV
MAVANAKGASPQMAITVMADENQRLKAFQNSTIADIRSSLGLHADEKTVFNLRKNYRNTREIAAFASRFYVGLPTGIPEPPTDTGPKPVLSMSAKESHGGALNDFVVKIARYMLAHPTEEIGVICMSDADRKSMFNRLKARLANDDIEVQTYASKDDDHPADALEFDVPGRLTVLNYHSAKGLEFDAAFIVDPGKLSSGGSSDLNVKMTLYVMCSRARQFLNLLIIRDQGCKRILDWIESSSLYKQEEL